MCARRSYDLTASCKAFPSYQGRAAETAFSIAGFLIERLEVLPCSLHECFREVTQGLGALITPGWNWQVPAARGEDNTPGKSLGTPISVQCPSGSGVLGCTRPPKTEFFPFIPPVPRAPRGHCSGTSSQKCVQRAQIKSAQTEGQGRCLQGDFSRRQQLHLLLRAAVPAREKGGISPGRHGEDTLAASLMGV